MSKSIFLFLFSCMIFSFSLGQKEAVHWYFGQGAGLVFRDGPPASTWQGRLNSQEACGAICDANGNLLMYSGGTIVLNAAHEIMPNGRDLGGHISSTESNLIVPAPQNPGFYYLFTTGAMDENFAAGLQYSVIDMSMDNGKGDVIVKNQRLFGPSAEKLAAIPHANGIDIWIISHEYDSDAFRAYLLTANGIEPAVILSNVGSRHTGLFPAAMNAMHPKNAVGAMATTFDGKKIAVAIFEDGIIELFDFDAATGRLSNPLTIPFLSKVYGLAFSTDKSKLYTTVRRPVGGIYQLDLQAGSASDIRNSAVLLGQPGGDGPGAIQLGPDGKLYIARWRQDFLAVVHRPNRKAPACDFVMDGIALRRQTSSELGLPIFLSSYLPVPPFNVYNAECVDRSVFFQFDDAAVVNSVLWDFGDPGSGGDNIATTPTAIHRYKNAGVYEVMLVRTYQGGRIDSSFRSIELKGKPTVYLGRDTILCTGDSLFFDLTQSDPNLGYIWSDGSTLPTFQIGKEGRYIARISNECGAMSDDIIVSYAMPPATQLGPDAGLCPDSTLLLSFTPQRLTSYIWQDGSRNEDFLVTQPGNYSLKIQNVCGSLTDSIHIGEANCDCELFIPNVFTPNGDDINDHFSPEYSCQATSFHLQIFDRWGRVVFLSESQEDRWDGSCKQDACPSGVYFYQLDFQGDARVTDTLEVHRGAVSLFR